MPVVGAAEAEEDGGVEDDIPSLSPFDTAVNPTLGKIRLNFRQRVDQTG